MTSRYAVLLQKRSGDSWAAMFGGTQEPKTVAYLIKTEDGGATWQPVEFKSEGDVQSLAASLNQLETEAAVAALRATLDDEGNP